ncbi:MAG: ethanolamine utilization protein EutJ [Deltaproteobacteria bacterium]|nr:ethanolamine utilization protein EutJ [Deltaproteobacteria bacterium]
MDLRGENKGYPYPLGVLQRIEKLADRMNRPSRWLLPEGRPELFVGVDLGTSYVVVVVVDDQGDPVGGMMQFATIAREGLILDYLGAIEIVKGMVESLQKGLGIQLGYASTSFPPKTESANIRTTQYVVESVGMKVLKIVDEPSAANRLLNVQNGAIVDIGGGTTGIAVVEDGEIIYTGDEPTGGTHLNLVIAGRKKISFEEAESYKLEHQAETLEITLPVIQKMATIVRDHIGDRRVEVVHLVGGTSGLIGMEKVVEEELGIPVGKPSHPQLVTPLGIAIACTEERSVQSGRREPLRSV